MRVSVREAAERDFDVVAALLAELGRPQSAGVPDEAAHRAAWVAYLARSDVVALVAETDDGTVVGFCDLEFRQRLAFGEPQAWIPDLIVTEVARGAGAGRALLARAEAIARARGAWSMSLESARWREASHEFYRRVGWKDTGLSFTRLLKDVQWPPAPPADSRE